jgi:Fur family transcriptional regulator, ferric uptake regulator
MINKINATVPRRMTKQRRVILEVLRGMQNHPTADELFWAVRKRLPKVSLGTIYRNLDVLVRQGLVRRLDTTGGQARFDGDLSLHYHVYCLGCGALGDVNADAVHPLRMPASTTPEFVVTGYTVEFEGYCPACRERGNSNEEIETREGPWS